MRITIKLETAPAVQQFRPPSGWETGRRNFFILQGGASKDTEVYHEYWKNNRQG